jgi:putative lipoprotein
MTGRRTVLLALASLLACGASRPPAPAPAAAAPAAPALADREWELLALGADAPPASDRPVTIRFDSGSRRAAGSSGCNRYSAAYTFRGDGELTFGPGASTRMACPEGMELERAFLDMLPKVTGYEIVDGTLVLRGADGPLARFRSP